jgi:hypothetical protein
VRHSTGALVVDGTSHVVVMEYEAWFGPNAVTFAPLSQTPRPLLTSPDMVAVGGGYDSEDPNVIRTHLGLLQSMGVDAAIDELTNNVSCIFDTGAAGLDPARLDPCGQTSAALNRSFQISMQQIAANDANLYTAWSKLGTPLKLVPLLACQDNGCLTPYSNSGAVTGFGIDPCPGIPGMAAGSLAGNSAITGGTSFERELAYYGALMAKYPDLNVVYQGKPLVLIFAPPGIDDDPCMMQSLHRLIVADGFDKKYTFRMMGGYFDTDFTFWNEPGGYEPAGPIPLAPGFGGIWWSWVDRLNAKFGEFPSYNPSAAGARAENFTASIATAGQDGWGSYPARCGPAPPHDPLSSCLLGTDYYIDSALRTPDGEPYGTFSRFMTIATALDPIFLILHQFNEFALPDEGWDANTTDDIEPANDGIGQGAVDAVRSEITQYRHSAGAGGTRGLRSLRP